jgi:peptidoglycan/xylan/chitin deacetylase (PgdA/CDA1 family)
VTRVWWAGVAWQERDLEVAVVDGTGRSVLPATRVPGGRPGELVDLLRGYADRSGEGLAAVVDSTNGVVDGHLLASGLRVFRADPVRLPARSPFGSAPAAALAGCAAADPDAVHEVTVAGGSLVGRAPEYLADIVRAARAERDLFRAGRYFQRGAGGAPLVAVTFDDGPDPGFTPLVLEILARYQATATFFCVGMNAAAHPDLVARVLDAGHGIGNHTWTHPYLPDLTRDELLRQVDATNDALRRVSGAPVDLFRPPYGSCTPETLGWLAEHGMTTVTWDVDARDWAAPGVPAITEVVGTSARDGSVILMHDGGGDRSQTVAALPAILEGLRSRGYGFGTVEQIIRPG